MKYTKSNCDLCSKAIILTPNDYRCMVVNYNGSNLLFCNYKCAYKYHVFNKYPGDPSWFLLQQDGAEKHELIIKDDGDVVWEKIKDLK